MKQTPSKLNHTELAETNPQSAAKHHSDVVQRMAEELKFIKTEVDLSLEDLARDASQLEQDLCTAFFAITENDILGLDEKETDRFSGGKFARHSYKRGDINYFVEDIMTSDGKRMLTMSSIKYNDPEKKGYTEYTLELNYDPSIIKTILGYIKDKLPLSVAKWTGLMPKMTVKVHEVDGKIQKEDRTLRPREYDVKFSSIHDFYKAVHMSKQILSNEGNSAFIKQDVAELVPGLLASLADWNAENRIYKKK
jgi:hypothetical protein